MQLTNLCQDNADLVTIVRSLDQNGPGENGENLQQLWICLTGSSGSIFHAAEESTLRWLLKSMSGTGELAELFRRYPLTWAILDCVVQRIPLFSLAKSLADRKFYATLQQTLKDISSPAETKAATKPTKRKRQSKISFTLDGIREQDGCLETAQAVFSMLKSLINRLDDTTTTFSRDKLGAQHIKSLFCTSAGDAAKLVAPALEVCRGLLVSDCDDITGAEEWIGEISWLWDLHLQSADDGLTVAIHLFRPAALILSKLGLCGTATPATVGGTLKSRWSSDLKTFMVRNLALPSRAVFADNKTIETFEQALAVSNKTTHIAAPAVFYLASHAFTNNFDSSLRRTNVEWIRTTFRAVETAIAKRPDRDVLMTTILEQAIERSISVDVADLRRVCREYALQGDRTEWAVVANIARCDPDVFQISDDGVELRDEVCRRSLAAPEDILSGIAVSNIIEALRDGFRTRRDFPNFLRFWFQQLCEVERQGRSDGSPWFASAQIGQPTASLSAMIESDLSPQQFGDLIKWTQENASRKAPRTLSLFASVLALAVRSDSFIEVAGIHLFDLIADIKGDKQDTSLRWRAVSKTVSWVTSSERHEVWAATKKRLKKILEKSSVSSPETYEAFKTCFQIWESMCPDDEQVDEPAGLVESFAGRLINEDDFTKSLVSAKLLSALELGANAELRDDLIYQQYLCWYLRGSCRFVTLATGTDGELPFPIATTVSNRKASTEALHATLTALLCNEINLNDTKLSRVMIDRLTTSITDTDEDKTWPDDRAKISLRALSSIPMACYDRTQRETLMTMLSQKRSAAAQASRSYDVDTWKLLTSFATKIMGKSTFPEGMGFGDLIETADMLSALTIAPKDQDLATLELMSRFSSLASATIRQMAEHIDQRSTTYFQEAASFVAAADKNASQATPLHMTLLKALAMELRRSQSASSHAKLSSLLAQCENTLLKTLSETIDQCISDNSALQRSDNDLAVFAATDAATTLSSPSLKLKSKPDSVRNFEVLLNQGMQDGNLKAWKIKALLQAHLQGESEVSRQAVFDDLSQLPISLREPLMKRFIESIVRNMRPLTKVEYLKALLDEFKGGCETDGQLLAIDHVVSQLIGKLLNHSDMNQS